MPSTEGIPLHKETGTSFHFQPSFMGKRALPWKECITLEWNAPSWFRGCNILYNVQILTQGNYASVICLWKLNLYELRMGISLESAGILGADCNGGCWKAAACKCPTGFAQPVLCSSVWNVCSNHSVRISGTWSY